MNVANRLEGSIIPRVVIGLPVECDYCSEDLDRGDRVTLYASSRDYGPSGNDHEFVIDRVYGVDCCKRKQIQFPCGGATEALFAATIDDGWKLRDVSIIDKSLSGNGAEWDPPNMWKLLTKLEVHDYLDSPGLRQMTAGPEDIYDTIKSLGVDVSEIVNEDGLLTVNDDELDALRADIDEAFVEKAQEIMQNR